MGKQAKKKKKTYQKVHDTDRLIDLICDGWSRAEGRLGRVRPLEISAIGS